MAQTERARSDAGDAEDPRPWTGTVTPVFPLLLLETLRDRDRPEEVLEDEDITSSMPRRLGLSEVVRVQIQRFQEEVRHRRPQPPERVVDLIKLVIRRPDCHEIVQAAGGRVADYFFAQRSGPARGLVRFLPHPLARRAAQRAGKRMFKQLTGGGSLRVHRWPMELSIGHSLTARADPAGEACGFYAGAFSRLLELYTGRKYRVLHPECEARGGARCQWTVEISG